MTKLAKWVLAAALAAAVAGGAQAQRQPGGGRGGFMPPPLEVTLLTNAELQKELKVTDDQKKALKPAMDKAEAVNKKRQELFTGGPPDMAVMDEMRKMGEELATAAKEAAGKALTDDQKKRLKQIDYQRMGLRAFANEEVVKALKITDEQKEKLKGISDEVQKEMQDLRQEFFGGGGPPDMEKMAEWQKKQKVITDEATDKAMKAMTDDQKKAWKEMTGAPFDVSKLQPQMRRRDN